MKKVIRGYCWLERGMNASWQAYPTTRRYPYIYNGKIVKGCFSIVCAV